LRSKIIKR